MWIFIPGSWSPHGECLSLAGLMVRVYSDTLVCAVVNEVVISQQKKKRCIYGIIGINLQLHITSEHHLATQVLRSQSATQHLPKALDLVQRPLLSFFQTQHPPTSLHHVPVNPADTPNQATPTSIAHL